MSVSERAKKAPGKLSGPRGAEDSVSFPGAIGRVATGGFLPSIANRVFLVKRSDPELIRRLPCRRASWWSAETRQARSRCRLSRHRDVLQTGRNVRLKWQVVGRGKRHPCRGRCHKRSVFVRRENRPTVGAGQGRFFGDRSEVSGPAETDTKATKSPCPSGGPAVKRL